LSSFKADGPVNVFCSEESIQYVATLPLPFMSMMPREAITNSLRAVLLKCNIVL
jgi:hypothetical protein